MAGLKKYEPLKLITMFRLAAALRNHMLEVGFTDNGGAIHSAERILNILGLRLCYPGLSHINNLRNHPSALFSAEALAAYREGKQVFIEHINPHRALTRQAIEKIGAGVSDEGFSVFVQENFKLALLTSSETNRLNKINRTRIAPDRLEAAGIVVAPSDQQLPPNKLRSPKM